MKHGRLSAPPLTLLWLLAQAGNPSAQTLPPEPVYRYLFVVDLSRAMAPHADAVRRAIFDCIAGGFDGQILPGETFGIWTYNDTANPRHFPPLTWQPSAAAEYADVAFRFLNLQRWQRTARPDLMLAEVFSAIRASPALTVFWFSATPVSMRNTPFGDSLEAFYRQIAAETQRARKPLLTTLVARSGEIAHAEAGFAVQPVRVPRRRPPAPTAAADTGSDPGPATGAKAGAAPLAHLPPRFSLKAPVVVVAPAVPPAAALEKPLVNVPRLEPLDAAGPTGDAPADQTQQPGPAEPARVAEAPPGRVGTAAPPFESSLTHTAQAGELTKAVHAAAVHPEPAFSSLGVFASRASVLVLAASLVMLSILLAWWIARVQRSARAPSLISQSLDRGPRE